MIGYLLTNLGMSDLTTGDSVGPVFLPYILKLTPFFQITQNVGRP
jgi:hypothetical protein